MCYENRDEEFARVCQERDELKRICVKQAEINGRMAAMALELDEVKAERDKYRNAEANGRLVAVDDDLALAMVAGSRAIAHNKRLIGASYLYDIWEVEGKQKEITYYNAARLLADKGYAALKGDKDG